MYSTPFSIYYLFYGRVGGVPLLYTLQSSPLSPSGFSVAISLSISGTLFRHIKFCTFTSDCLYRYITFLHSLYCTLHMLVFINVKCFSVSVFAFSASYFRYFTTETNYRINVCYLYCPQQGYLDLTIEEFHLLYTRQCCRSGCIQSGSGYGSRSSISSESGSRVFYDQKWKRNILLNFLNLFWSKIAIYLSLVFHKERPSYRRSLQLSKGNIQDFKRWYLLTGQGHFCSPVSDSGSGLRIRIRIHGPPWIWIQSGYVSGSGSLNTGTNTVCIMETALTTFAQP